MSQDALAIKYNKRTLVTWGLIILLIIVAAIVWKISQDREQELKASDGFRLAKPQESKIELCEQNFLNRTPSYYEALKYLNLFAHHTKHQGGHKMFYDEEGTLIKKREADVCQQILLAFAGSTFKLSPQVHIGNARCDFELSKGAFDSTIIEVKCAANRSLKKNLLYQSYIDSHRANQNVFVIVYFTDKEKSRMERLLKELQMDAREDVICVDLRYGAAYPSKRIA